MPGLDYTKAENGPSMGAFARPLVERVRFYDGSPGRELMICADCQRPADALFGDHGGECVDETSLAVPKSALGVIRTAAKKHVRFSANDVRQAFETNGVKPTSRGPAFAQAVRRGWIEEDGSVKSLDPGTKRHRVQTYRSLIHPEAVQQAKAAAVAGQKRAQHVR